MPCPGDLSEQEPRGQDYSTIEVPPDQTEAGEMLYRVKSPSGGILY